MKTFMIDISINEGAEIRIGQLKPVIHCAECAFFPYPDGLAHRCDYWGRITNQTGWCNNARPKSK